MLKKNEEINNCLIAVFYLYLYFTYLVVRVDIIYCEGVIKFYRVQHKETKEFFILRGYSFAPIASESSNLNSVDAASNRKKEIEDKKQKFEEFVAEWKAAMVKSKYIAKYIDHWYDDSKEYCYVVSEYCTKRNLGKEIKKKINEKTQFTPQVCRCC
jgi:serine/threonine protein kinase